MNLPSMTKCMEMLKPRLLSYTNYVNDPKNDGVKVKMKPGFKVKGTYRAATLKVAFIAIMRDMQRENWRGTDDEDVNKNKG